MSCVCYCFFDELVECFVSYGVEFYGEVVSQVEYVLQCVILVECVGCLDSFVVVVLLYDIGYFYEDLVQIDEEDLCYEEFGVCLLCELFLELVWQLVCLYVLVKCFFCVVDLSYYVSLLLVFWYSLVL